jgi:hypothetical protein
MESKPTAQKRGAVAFFIAMIVAIKNLFADVNTRTEKYLTVGKTQGFGAMQATYKRDRMVNDAGVVELIMSFAIAAILLAMVVVILASVQTATPAINASSPYYALQTTVTNTTVSGMGLLVIVLIVMAAVGILGVLLMLRKGN